MSSEWEKIKYCEEGAYASTVERTLICQRNNTCDITTFYDDKGNILFSFDDTLNDNLFEKMVEIINNWKDNPNVIKMNFNEILEFKKL